MRVEIILPDRRMDKLSDALVAITAAIDAADPDRVAHGFLGGQHGYGGNWSSDVFDMRPYYWGDCLCGGVEADTPCEPSCPTELPNFLYKPTGLEVRWYKYIGRGQEVSADPGDIAAMLANCLSDVTTTVSQAQDGNEAAEPRSLLKNPHTEKETG